MSISQNELTDRADVLPMSSGSDEVEHGVDTVVPEARVTLDTRLLGEKIIILPLEITDNLGETVSHLVREHVNNIMMRIIPGLVVNRIAESRSVDDGQQDASSLLVQLKL